MNIYDYIYDYALSKDVAEHCKKVGHVFSSLDMAVLVAFSGRTVKKKHAAWREIIENYPDMPIHESSWFEAQESLHNYLRELIEFEEKQIRDFYTPEEGFVYYPIVSRHSVNRLGCYSTAEKAWDVMAKYYAEYYKNREDAKSIWLAIEKVRIDGDHEEDSVLFDFTDEGEVIHGLESFGKHKDLDSIFIHIPVPFENGDLVEDGNGEPCVIIGDLPHKNENYKEYVSGEAGWDSSDMCVLAYYGYEYFIAHNHPRYYRLNYCTEKLEGEKRFLKYLSQYLKMEKDHQNPCWLVSAFQVIWAEAESERIRDAFKNTGLLKELDE